MKFIEQGYEWKIKPTQKDVQLIEEIGRICHKSDKSITDFSFIPFVKKIIELGHESVLEHSIASVEFITSRRVTHQLVRHRLVSFTQESQRYVDYSDGVVFIKPHRFKGSVDLLNEDGSNWQYWFNFDDDILIYFSCLTRAEESYQNLRSHGWTKQDARDVLPNCVATKIVVTANFREWRHILKLRTDKTADPEIRNLMIPLLKEFKTLVPVIFDDINVEE